MGGKEKKLAPVPRRKWWKVRRQRRKGLIIGVETSRERGGARGGNVFEKKSPLIYEGEGNRASGSALAVERVLSTPILIISSKKDWEGGVG